MLTGEALDVHGSYLSLSESTHQRVFDLLNLSMNSRGLSNAIFTSIILS